MTNWPNSFDAEMRMVNNIAQSWVLASPDGRELATVGPWKKFEINSTFLVSMAMFLFIFGFIALMVIWSGNALAPIFIIFLLIGIVVVAVFLGRMTGSRSFRTDSSEYILQAVRKKETLNSMAIRCTSGSPYEPVFMASPDTIEYHDGKIYRLLNDVTSAGIITRVLGIDPDNKYNRVVVQLIEFSDTSGGGANIAVNFADEDAPYVESLVAYTTYYYHITKIGGGAAVAQ